MPQKFAFRHPAGTSEVRIGAGGRWYFNPGFGGKGYAHEAAAALFTYLFTERTARRLYTYVEDTNASSQRLCERLGMRQEGLFWEFITFRNDDCGAPIYENTMQYALLRNEWLSRRSSPKSTVGSRDQ